MTENDSAEKGHKKRRISLLLKDRPRFKCVSQNEVLMLEKKTVPKTTEYLTRWAMKVFDEWFIDYNSRNPSEMCPNIVLTPSCPDQLKKWLIVFATEMINANGENCPIPRSINSMFKYIYSLLSFLINSSVSNKSMCNTNL